jgi:hypothetical protein
MVDDTGKSFSDRSKGIQQALGIQYEEQLTLLGLGKAQIEGQTIQELKDSLERVNDAIANPDSFPKFNIAFGGMAGIPYVTKGDSEAHYQITILPTLLERKKLILERIRSSENNEKVESLQDLINKKLIDKDDQERLKKELNQYILESQSLKEQYQQVINVQSEQIEKTETEKLKLSVELWERRSKVFLSFLERESAATIIGAILLILIAFAHIVAIGFKITIPETLNSAFLLILGYFFGQSTNQASSTKNIKDNRESE